MWIAKEFEIEKFTSAALQEEDTDLKELQGWLESFASWISLAAPSRKRRQNAYVLANPVSTLMRSACSLQITRINELLAHGDYLPAGD